MIDPYMAVALQTNVHHVTSRAETRKNLIHIGNMIDFVVHMCSIELPVKLIALSEGAVQGYVDEILDMNQAELSLSKTRFSDLSWENRGMILIDDWDLETDSGFLLRAFQIGSAIGSREHLFEAPTWRPST
jgi:hypothetical protein